MGQKDERPDGRDYATLMGMGWTPDTVGEAVTIAADLLEEGQFDAALAAVESARGSLLTGSTPDDERAALEAVAFEVALGRADATRAIAAANALRAVPALPQGEVARLRTGLSRSSVFRVELREALERVLDAVLASSADPGSLRSAGADADLFSFGGGEDELPYLEADPGVLGSAEPDSEAPAAMPAGATSEAPVLDWDPPTEAGATESGWTPGEFISTEGEDFDTLRARFLDAASATGTEHAHASCDTAWSFFLMEDYAAAALLFDQALGDPAVRVSAAEGLVRCRLNLAQARDAVVLLERLQALCYGEGLPEALRYWYGRAAEAAGDVRKARAAYRSLPAAAFPDVRGRLGGLP